MRCYCCNRALNDYESTLKSKTTGEYLDTCNKCLRDLDIPFAGNNQHNPHALPCAGDAYMPEMDEEQ